MLTACPQHSPTEFLDPKSATNPPFQTTQTTADPWNPPLLDPTSFDPPARAFFNSRDRDAQSEAGEMQATPFLPSLPRDISSAPDREHGQKWDHQVRQKPQKTAVTGAHRIPEPDQRERRDPSMDFRSASHSKSSRWGFLAVP
eukprot:c16980_g2_i1 orf=275-703(+)